MESNEYDYIGYLAGASLCCVLIPQIYKIWKLKSSEEISCYFIFLGIITGILYLIYGIFIKAIPIIVTNVIVLLQNLIFLYMKKKYDNTYQLEV
jgi:MtN3 and saliva related transmembrane protein